ncbi:MAG TPA: hypothetical protein VMS17_22020 [Gemmataceae bacterium]|nr:hypothetical protein [Gemmataceae bacterium]
MKHILSAFGLALLVAAAAQADDVCSKPLTLHPPAAAPRAVQYALLPDLMDTTTGNAAEHYRRAAQKLRGTALTDLDQILGQWLATPLKDLPLDRVAILLKKYESAFREVDAGARCEQCDWGLTEELRRTGSDSGIDVFAHLEIGKLLALRCRYEPAEGHAQEAMRTLRIGLTLARRLGDAPSLPVAIFGSGVGSYMLTEVEEVVQQPDAPSLYWPLTDLPQPLFDLRKPMEGERIAVYGFFPGAAEMAADPNAKPWTPEQVVKAMNVLRVVGASSNRLLRTKNYVEMLLRIAARHEAAKKALIAEGRPNELVDAMPHVQVALLVALRHWDRAFDESLEGQSLPYPERLAAWSTTEAQQQEVMDDPHGPAIPLWRLHPRDGRRWFAFVAPLDRKVAALRCVEVVRLYAAGHDGKLPASLDDIKDVPIPIDPIAGRPFDYRRVGDRAFLSCTPFPGETANNFNTPTYELIFVQ